VLYYCPSNCHRTWVRGQWKRPAHPRCLAHSTAATPSAPTPPSRPGQTPVSFEARLATRSRRRLRCRPVRSWWKAGSWTGCSWAHCLLGTGSGAVCPLLWCRKHWNNAVIVVIRNSVFNRKTQLKEGDKQRWPISFYWKPHTVTLIRRRINILLVECDLHNGKSLFVPLAKLGFPINYEFRIKSINKLLYTCIRFAVEQ